MVRHQPVIELMAAFLTMFFGIPQIVYVDYSKASPEVGFKNLEDGIRDGYKLNNGYLEKGLAISTHPEKQEETWDDRN